MLVSVVIPVFNRPESILRAVNSVLGQTWSELECVVVDDGSTDETPAALATLRDTRLTVVRTQNRGVSAARNTGIAAAKGELIALLDSDDRFVPEKLAVQVPFMLTRGLHICQTEEVWIRHGSRVNPGHKHAKPAGRIFARAVDICCVSPSCTMFDRIFWNACGPFDETLPACEDYDLWLRAALTFDIGLVPAMLTVKDGGRADQLSRKFVGLDLYRIRALAALLARPDLPSAERRLAAAALARKALIYRRGCLLNGNPEEAERIRAMVAPFLEEEESGETFFEKKVSPEPLSNKL